MKACRKVQLDLYDIGPASPEFLAKAAASKLFVTDQLTIVINKALGLIGSLTMLEAGKSRSIV
ncbi:MAG: hypothetical protein J7L92_00035 [Dehalococcoidia bacterium]|nr:hypothetical protein [Dehalococcoidia bacterium]